jgi:hypothetical protein
MHRAVASDILAESTNLHLVWEDDRNSFDDNFEIYYRMSTDLGQTWGSEVRLTDTLNKSCGPSLACDGRYLHLFWFDLRDDTTNRWGEIYYKRKSLLVSISENQVFTALPYDKIEIFPIPCSQQITIRNLIQNTQDQTQNTIIKIFDAGGKEVMSCGLINQAEETRVDMRNLPCGVYFMQIKTGNAIATRKVIKIR